MSACRRRGQWTICHFGLRTGSWAMREGESALSLRPWAAAIRFHSDALIALTGADMGAKIEWQSR